MVITRIASKPLFVPRFSGDRTGKTNSRNAAMGHRGLVPFWTKDRPLGLLDAARAPGKPGRPTPFPVRFAHCSTRGQGAWPSALNAPPPDPLPAPTAWGAWTLSLSPTTSPAALGLLASSATVCDLPAAALRLPLSSLCPVGPGSLGGGGWTPGPTLRVAPLRASAIAQPLRADGLPTPHGLALPDRASVLSQRPRCSCLLRQSPLAQP